MIERPNFLATLADAAGDDPALQAELHGVFLEAADIQLHRMAAGYWGDAAQRLAGLAASFGATTLMALASEADGEGPSEARLALLRGEIARLRTIR